MVDHLTNKQTFLYQFLTAPGYRIARHVLLFLAVTVTSFNQNIFTYGAKADILGNYIYLAVLCTVLTYAVVGYLHIYLFIPRLLLKKKYAVYLLCSSASIGLLMLIRALQEYGFFSLAGIPPVRSSYFHIVGFLDSLSDFMLNMLCIVGVSMTVLLKYRTMESLRVNQLEREQIRSEVNNLKEQVNPSLLFNTLNQTAALAKCEPQKAADLVLRLSQLLRYQLYDGAREKTLLSSELSFLNNYLALEKCCTGGFDYKLVSKGNLLGAVVAPLLPVPIVQYAIKRLNSQTGQGNLTLETEKEGKRIHITCRFEDNSEIMEKEFDGFRARLNLLYPDNYLLSATHRTNPKESMISLTLHTHEI